MTPKYFEEPGPFDIPIASIFAAVKSVIELGDEKAFIKVCEERKLTVSASAEVINLTKEHLFEHNPKERSFMESKSAQLSLQVQECDDSFDCF